MDKEVVNIHNGIICSYKKGCICINLMRWMNLKPIKQSEKYQYCILLHIYGIQKDSNDDLKCKAAKETQM